MDLKKGSKATTPTAAAGVAKTDKPKRAALVVSPADTPKPPNPLPPAKAKSTKQAAAPSKPNATSQPGQCRRPPAAGAKSNGGAKNGRDDSSPGSSTDGSRRSAARTPSPSGGAGPNKAATVKPKLPGKPAVAAPRSTPVAATALPSAKRKPLAARATSAESGGNEEAQKGEAASLTAKLESLESALLEVQSALTPTSTLEKKAIASALCAYTGTSSKNAALALVYRGFQDAAPIFFSGWPQWNERRDRACDRARGKGMPDPAPSIQHYHKSKGNHWQLWGSDKSVKLDQLLGDVENDPTHKHAIHSLEHHLANIKRHASQEAKPTDANVIYYAVVFDHVTVKGLRVGQQYQGYIGKAASGAVARWHSHRDAAKKLLTGEVASVSLVDALLACNLLRKKGPFDRRVYVFTLCACATTEELDKQERKLIAKCALRSPEFGLNKV